MINFAKVALRAKNFTSPTAAFYRVLPLKLKFLICLFPVLALLSGFVDSITLLILPRFIAGNLNSNAASSNISLPVFIEAIESMQQDTILRFIFLLVILSLALRSAILYYNSVVAASIGSYIANKYFKLVLRSPYRILSSFGSSGCITSATKNVDYSTTLFFASGNFIFNFTTAVAVAFSIFAIEPALSILLIIAVTLIYFGYSVFSDKYVTKLSSQFLRSFNQTVEIINIAVTGAREVRIHSLQSNLLSSFRLNERTMRLNGALTTTVSLIPRQIFEPIILLGFALISFTTRSNELNSIDSLILLALGFQKLIPAAQSSYNSFVMYRSSFVGAVSLLKDFKLLRVSCNDFAGETSNINNSIKKIQQLLSDSDSITLGIKPTTINNINDDTLLLHKSSDAIQSTVNLTLNKGEIIGITGNSGSGKTTFAEYLVGLLKVYDLTILLRSKASSISYQFDSCRVLENLLCYVPQNPTLFPGSIYYNVRFKQPTSSIDSEYVKALKLAQIDFAGNAEQKEITSINEGLSGGQKQRVAIARAICSNKPILIFDEATTGISSNLSKCIISNLRNSSFFSIIIISHDQEVLSICNKVYDIHDLVNTKNR
jgi:ABC-type multidrug transport system fused ATPase/permease subunit